MKRRIFGFYGALAAITALAICCVTISSVMNTKPNYVSSSIANPKDEIYEIYEKGVKEGKIAPGTTYDEWLDSIKGEDGKDGNGVSKIEKTGTSGNVDTYTITYTDGTTTTFTVTNGKDGSQGIQGEKGENGHTPIITIGEDGYWYVDGVKTDTKATGQSGAAGRGILSITKEDGDGTNVDTYKITYTDGTSSYFTVYNGVDGEKGDAPSITIGEDGYWYVDGVKTDTKAEGSKGEEGDRGNGILSIAKTGTSGNVDTYTITYTNGEKTTFTVVNGKDGNGIAKIEKTGTSGNVDTYTITYTDGSTATFTVTNGKDGSQGIRGEKGEKGDAPVVTIGEDGYWYVDGVRTNTKAEGTKGDTGAQGPKGEQGEQGNPGQDAPHAGEKVTVTYNVNGGTMPDGVTETIIVNWGDCLDLPIPSKPRCEFLGWWIETANVNDPTRQWTIRDAVFANIELTARWDDPVYEISLNASGGTCDIDKISIKGSSEYSLPDSTMIARPGYVFTGWYDSTETKWETHGTYTFNGDVALTAGWTILTTRDFAINPNGGTLGGSETNVDVSITNEHLYDGEGIYLPIPERSGFVFKGYSFCGALVVPSSGVVKNWGAAREWTTLNAMWADENGGLAGDVIEFGRYPQSLVTDETIIDGLSSALDSNGNGWLELNEKEYAPLNGKYYEVEPLIWKILDASSGLIMSIHEIDAMSYSPVDDVRTIDDGAGGKVEIQRNNYYYSSIRAWMNSLDGTSYQAADYSNGGFLKRAFTEAENEMIRAETVDNSTASTGLSFNDYVCADTTDKVFALSYAEAKNASYGLDAANMRRTIFTDYAEANGAFSDDWDRGRWWLRSPNSSEYYVRSVNGDGSFYEAHAGKTQNAGVRPALKITL